MLRIDETEKTGTSEQERDEGAVADAAPDLPHGDLVMASGAPVFRDCRGQLVWLG